MIPSDFFAPGGVTHKSIPLPDPIVLALKWRSASLEWKNISPTVNIY